MAIMLEQYSSQGLKTNKAKDQECIRFDVVVVVVIVVGFDRTKPGVGRKPIIIDDGRIQTNSYFFEGGGRYFFGGST